MNGLGKEEISVEAGEEVMVQDNETHNAERKVTEIEVEGDAKRAIDEIIWVRGLGEMGNSIRNMYENIEVSMQNIVMEARKVYLRDGWDDVVDGPRSDILKRIRAILKPSSDHLYQTVIHELCHINNLLKCNISDI